MKQKIPHGEEGLICPFHKMSMEQVCHKCPLWVQIRGKNPQSHEEIDDWQCAITWLPLLLIQVAQETRQGAAATESFRNAVVTISRPQVSRAPEPILIEDSHAV